jgi:hypothetical protein
MHIAMIAGLACTSLVFAAAPAAGGSLPTDHPLLHDVAADIRPGELRSAILRLVGFGTRHTLSDTQSEMCGIGAARRWLKVRFEEIGRGCGGCLDIRTPVQTITGQLIPKPTEIMDVLAIQSGTSDPTASSSSPATWTRE